MGLVLKWRRRRRKSPPAEAIIARATDIILEERLFLNPALKCSDVAGRIGTNRTYMWEALRKRGFGFQDYLSKFRIRHFIQNAATFAKLRSNEIAEACGFNSAKSMNKYLKIMMGLTLVDYMRRIERIPFPT